jgi:enoyl-CoA hydratase
MIHHETHDTLTVLRMDHGKANALDVELLDALSRALEDTLESDAEAVVLTGTGQIFSAGVDLFRIVDGGAEYVERFFPALSETLRQLFAFPRPVVAAVGGHAIAGGCILAAACDLKVMASADPATGKAGRIGVPELRVGVPFPASALEILRFAMPAQHLQELAYVGRTFTPDEALARGLVDELVEPSALLDRALELARVLAATPPATFRLVKTQLRRPTLDWLESLEDIDDEALELWTSPEIHDHIREYLERTFGKKGQKG